MVLATSSDSHEGLGHFPHFVGAHSRDKHPRRVRRQSAVHSGCSVQTPLYGTGPHGRLRTFMSSIRPVQVKRLARVGPVAIAFALGVRPSPGRSNELVKLFTLHRFEYDPHGALRQRSQVLMEDVLLQYYGGR
jgi:hypothetical protein